MRIIYRTTMLAFITWAVGTGSVSTAQAPGGTLDSPSLGPAEAKRVVSEFASGEASFRKAFQQYGYKREVIIQTLDNGQVSGEYRRVTRVVLGKDGKLAEEVILFPEPTLTQITVTKDDLEDLGDRYQFALESAQLAKYELNFQGKERLQNIDLFVFDVKPLSVLSKERLFSGKVWVDAENLRVVKMRGVAKQKGEQRFAELETFRTVVDGRYLFPSISSGEEEIVFGRGSRVRLRMQVRYSEYVKLL